MTIYIVVYIGKKRVSIRYNHLFKYSNGDNLICFTPRSHKLFNELEIVREVKNHFYKYHLYPEGRSRDLQLKHKIPKDRFIKWYKTDYLFQKKLDEDAEYLDMLDEYYPTEPQTTWAECYNMLNACGVLYDFNTDEYGHEDMTECVTAKQQNYNELSNNRRKGRQSTTNLNML